MPMNNDSMRLVTAVTLGACAGASIAALMLRKRVSSSLVPVRSAATSMSQAPVPASRNLPRVYVYDHCPFCIRVRTILGLKRVKHELVFLANDDEATPIGLVGAKQVPIFQLPSGQVMAESMDIVRYVDATYGDAPMLQEASKRPELQQWIDDSAEVMRQLYHPRYYRGFFPEFAQQDSRAYYRNKKEKSIGSFDDALAKTPALLKEANEHLQKLATLLESNRTVNREPSYDDIDLFSRLRGFTIIKGLQWPAILREYLEYYSVKADVPLLDAIAQ